MTSKNQIQSLNPLSSLPQEPTILNTTSKGFKEAEKVIRTIHNSSTLPPEWEVWLKENPELSKTFFKELKNLGPDDTLTYTQGINITVAGKKMDGAVKTEVSHNGDAVAMDFCGDVEYTLATVEVVNWKSDNVKASVEAEVSVGAGSCLEFEFDTPQDLLNTLGKSEKNLPSTFEPLDILKNQILEPQSHSSQSPSNLKAVELHGDLSADLNASLEVNLPASSKNSFTAKAEGAIGANLGLQGKFEWDQNENPYLVLTQSFSVGGSYQGSVQVNALKSLKMDYNQNASGNIEAKLVNEKRIPLPRDFNYLKASTQDIKKEMISSLTGMTQTESLVVTFEKPEFTSQNEILIEGEEWVFTQDQDTTENTTTPQNPHLSANDILNAFTNNKKPSQITHYTKNETKKTVDMTILGQGIVLKNENALVDVHP